MPQSNERSQSGFPIVVEPRNSYARIVARIVEAAGEWVEVDLSAVGGLSPAVKQTRLHQAGRQRGHRLETAIRAGRGYARLICAVAVTR